MMEWGKKINLLNKLWQKPIDLIIYKAKYVFVLFIQFENHNKNINHVLSWYVIVVPFIFTELYNILY